MGFTLTHYQTTDFRLFQAYDNFKFDENGRKLSKQVENTVGKGEIACYSVFKRLVSQRRQKVSLWEWVTSLPKENILDWSKFKAFADNKIN